MPPKKKELVIDNPNDALDQQLQKLGFGGFVDMAKSLEGLTISTISTGFPGLDQLLCERMPGLARGRDIEIFSDKGQAGKSTLAAGIVKGWQEATHFMKMADDLETIQVLPLEDRLKTAWIEVEGTTTLEYLHDLKVGLWDSDVPGGYRLRYYPADPERTTEDVLNLIKGVSNIFDLVVVDSVASLCTKSDMEKSMDENSKIASLPQLLGRHYRKNTVKKATILWLNQTRGTMQTSQNGAPINKPTGGQAQSFFPSVKLQLTEVEKLKEQEEVWGVKTKVFTAKNKTSPQYRSCVLNMVLGRGFSAIYDYMEQARAVKLLTQKASWYTLTDAKGNELVKAQGERKIFEALDQDPILFQKLVAIIDGEAAEEKEETPV